VTRKHELLIVWRWWTCEDRRWVLTSSVRQWGRVCCWGRWLHRTDSTLGWWTCSAGCTSTATSAHVPPRHQRCVSSSSLTVRWLACRRRRHPAPDLIIFTPAHIGPKLTIRALPVAVRWKSWDGREIYIFLNFYSMTAVTLPFYITQQLTHCIVGLPMRTKVKILQLHRLDEYSFIH